MSPKFWANAIIPVSVFMPSLSLNSPIMIPAKNTNATPRDTPLNFNCPNASPTAHTRDIRITVWRYEGWNIRFSNHVIFLCKCCFVLQWHFLFYRECRCAACSAGALPVVPGSKDSKIIKKTVDFPDITLSGGFLGQIHPDSHQMVLIGGNVATSHPVLYWKTLIRGKTASNHPV